MSTLPSMWNLIISTIVFFVSAWYIRRYMEEQGIPKSMARGMLVFVLAAMVSWGSGEVVDWIQEKIEGPQPPAQTSGDIRQLLQEAGQGNSNMFRAFDAMRTEGKSKYYWERFLHRISAPCFNN